MPNTPALVRLGACAIAAGAAATDDDVAWARTVLEAVGTVDEVDEAALDAFTGVAGSGPAYVFLLAEALVDAAVLDGLDRAMAERVVRSSCSVRPRCSSAMATRPACGRWSPPRRHHRCGARRARGARPPRHGGRSGARSDSPQPRTRLSAHRGRRARRSRIPIDQVGNFIAVFLVCHFSHRSAWPMVNSVVTRSPATVSSADGAGAIGGLAPALVAYGGTSQ